MKILIQGPPASGKGTQARRLSEYLNIPKFSTGDLLRKMPKDHPRYAENKKIMDTGGLSPNDLVADLMKSTLSEVDSGVGYILDGYARRLGQIELFEPELDMVIVINIPNEEILKRITGRRICQADGKIYNIFTLSSEELKGCPGELVIRDDDREEVVKERIERYEEDTIPVINYFREKGFVTDVDGTVSPEEVFEQIKSAVDKRRSKS